MPSNEKPVKSVKTPQEVFVVPHGDYEKGVMLRRTPITDVARGNDFKPENVANGHYYELVGPLSKDAGTNSFYFKDPKAEVHPIQFVSKTRAGALMEHFRAFGFDPKRISSGSVYGNGR
ncbi:MAG: hypothetical protein WCX64_04035 [Candidatus Micrarchaeia archaeon]